MGFDKEESSKSDRFRDKKDPVSGAERPLDSEKPKLGIVVQIDQQLISCQKLMKNYKGIDTVRVSQTIFQNDNLFDREKTELFVYEGEEKTEGLRDGKRVFTLDSTIRLSDQMRQKSDLGYFSDDKVSRVIDNLRSRGFLPVVTSKSDQDQQQAIFTKNGLYFIVNFGYKNKEALEKDYNEKINNGNEFEKAVFMLKLEIAKKNNFQNESISLWMRSVGDIQKKDNSEEIIIEEELPVVGDDAEKFQSVLNTYTDVYQNLLNAIFEIEEITPPSLTINIGKNGKKIRDRWSFKNNQDKLDIPVQTGTFFERKRSEVRSEDLPIKFEDIAGQEKAIDEAKKFVMGIKKSEVYESRGVKPIKGMLLYGPPGNGKTLIAKAIANESGAEFIPISVKDIASKYYGDTEKRIGEYFEKANNITKETGKTVILFFDEMEALAPKRNESHEATQKMISVLLTNIDGIGANSRVRILGATNRLESLDDAILRSGRIDRCVEVPLPEEKGREAILKLHIEAAKKRATSGDDLFSRDIDLSHIAKLTQGLSGADLANLVNSVLGAKVMAEIEGVAWTPVTTLDLIGLL